MYKAFMPTLALHLDPATLADLDRARAGTAPGTYAAGLLRAALRANLTPLESGVPRGRARAEDAQGQLLRFIAAQGAAPIGACTDALGGDWLERGRRMVLNLVQNGVLEWTADGQIRVAPRPMKRP